VALFICALAGKHPPFVMWRPMVALIFAIAPIVTHVQALSLAFLWFGLAFALVWARSPASPAATVLAVSLAFLRALPGQWLGAMNPRNTLLWHTGFGAGEPRLAARSLLRDWAFPVAGTLVFAALLMQANPVFARILAIDLDLWETLSRALFWAAAAVFVTPFLTPSLPAPLAVRAAVAMPLSIFGINAASVLRALLLFNVMIGLQTLTDISILMGGVDLPKGMNVATYAHRGAYPLFATALLAGIFALAARPYLGEHRAILPLLLVWIAQNMVLCGAAMLRLDHYVETFGLTYLRIYALIWMGLVAIGLGLLLWQVSLRRSNSWLLIRCALVGFGALYACCFINFAHIIAAQNLKRPVVDFDYVCDLGPMAGAAFSQTLHAQAGIGQAFQWCYALRARPQASWQEWGFRSWQVGRYIARAEPERQRP
jgi:Domain of unknown function (DUF4173)